MFRCLCVYELLGCEPLFSTHTQNWRGKVSLWRVRFTGIRDQTVAASMSSCLRKDSGKLLDGKFSMFRDELNPVFVLDRLYAFTLVVE